MKRRDFVAYVGAAGASAIAGVGQVFGVNGHSVFGEAGTDLHIQPAHFVLRDQPTEHMVSVFPDSPPPVLVGKQGKPMTLNVINGLDEYTTMHWHGVRLPNAMDGVPYLTQAPVISGKSFLYNFTPPDAGTYWYHPHCMTMTQMARGLTGVLLIQEADSPEFDGDRVINLRDFRLDQHDAFRQSYTMRGAARSGTLGNVMTANWLQAPVYDHPTGGLVRLRLANTDTTRIYRLYLAGGDNRIIARDGHPLERALPTPNEKQLLVLGPGQRADFAVVMPGSEGKQVDILAKVPGREQKVMAVLRAKGVDLKRSLMDVTPLPKNPVSEPDLSVAQLHELVIGWSPDGLEPNNGFCGTLGKTFWSINRKPWPGDNASGTVPLVTFKRGNSYILRLRNETPNMHPMHVHGLTFKPVASNKRTIAPNWTDTMLLLKNETVDIALVADNPGDWAFHCHVIEHQKTGLTGFVRVV